MIEEEKPDITPVIFQIKIGLQIFFYSVPYFTFLEKKIEREQNLGKPYEKWNQKEKKQFWMDLRYSGRLMETRSPTLEDLENIPFDIMTEEERSCYLSLTKKRRLKNPSLEDLERMKEKRS